MVLYIKKGDVLKSQNEVLFITAINRRLLSQDNTGSQIIRDTTFSIGDDELSKYELIFSEGGAE